MAVRRVRTVLAADRMEVLALQGMVVRRVRTVLAADRMEVLAMRGMVVRRVRAVLAVVQPVAPPAPALRSLPPSGSAMYPALLR